MTKYRLVAYYRVSTDRQSRSGLGLEDQRAEVDRWIVNNDGSLIAEFTDVESGRVVDRPELERALATCRTHKATLIVAKLDRLARNVSLLLKIVDSNIDTVFCNLPSLPPGPTGRFMLQQMAAVAELERGLISERTKAALRVAKERGKKLGSPKNLTNAGRATGQTRSLDRRRRDAKIFAADLSREIEAIQSNGHRSLSAIARELNQRGIPTRRGGQWQATTVRRVISAQR